MTQEDKQWDLTGLPPFDVWDQQVDETEDEWNDRLERMRVEAESVPAIVPDPYAPLPGETDTQYDQRVDQQRDEAAPFSEPSPDDIAHDEELTIAEAAVHADNEARVTVCPPVPAQPMTLEALQEMAAKALANIKGNRSKKPKSAMSDVHEEDVGWVQESFIPAHCVNEGGSGLECMMCNGQACRFCGFGCWDREAPRCEHEVEFRHSWDPVAEERRLALQEAEMKALGISEARRQEMMDKIFDGDPSLTHIIYCVNCNQEVRTGEVVYVTSKGTFHSRDCTAQNEPAAKVGNGADPPS